MEEDFLILRIQYQITTQEEIALNIFKKSFK